MQPPGLRQDQMDGMVSRCRMDFERRLLLHLRQAFPELTREAADQELLERARPATERAKQHGITAEYDVVRFVDLTFLFGADFNASPLAPWAHGVLEDQMLAGWQKADILWARARDQLLQAAACTGR